MEFLAVMGIVAIAIVMFSMKRGSRCYNCKHRNKCVIKASGNSLEILSCNQYEEMEKRD